jgi:hypothetical protein
MSLSLVAPSAVAVLSTVLLSGTAASQTATGATNQLPSITVQAPKQAARPHRAEPVVRPQRRAPPVATTVAARPTSPAPQTPPTTAQKPAPGSAMARIAALEKTSSNCTDGCQTSFKYGNAPWNGCNASGGVFSPTCRNVRNFKTYTECVENGLLLGYRSSEQWAYCTSLATGQKFQAAELKASGRPRSP